MYDRMGSSYWSQTSRLQAEDSLEDNDLNFGFTLGLGDDHLIASAVEDDTMGEDSGVLSAACKM